MADGDRRCDVPGLRRTGGASGGRGPHRRGGRAGGPRRRRHRGRVRLGRGAGSGAGSVGPRGGSRPPPAGPGRPAHARLHRRGHGRAPRRPRHRLPDRVRGRGDRPRLVLESIADLCLEGRIGGDSPPSAEAQRRFREAVEDGVLKVMSKMGISTVESYRSAQIFEAVGLGPEVVDACLTGTPSPLGGDGVRGDRCRRPGTPRRGVRAHGGPHEPRVHQAPCGRRLPHEQPPGRPVAARLAGSGRGGRGPDRGGPRGAGDRSPAPASGAERRTGRPTSGSRRW